MKTNFLFVCDSATIPEGVKKLNVSGIFDSIGSQGFPATHSSLAIVVNLEITEEEQNKPYIESFKILSEKKVVLEDSTSFEPKNSRHQFVHRISNLILEKPGRYDVQILVGEKIVGESYFFVKQI